MITRRQFERELKWIQHSRISILIDESLNTINTMAKAKTKKKPASRKPAPSKSKIDLNASTASIESLASNIKLEVADFVEKGTKAAARRARKAAQELRKLCAQTRKDITEKVKSL